MTFTGVLPHPVRKAYYALSPARASRSPGIRHSGAAMTATRDDPTGRPHPTDLDTDRALRERALLAGSLSYDWLEDRIDAALARLDEEGQR